MKSKNDEGKQNFSIQYSKFNIRYSKGKKKTRRFGVKLRKLGVIVDIGAGRETCTRCGY